MTSLRSIGLLTARGYTTGQRLYGKIFSLFLSGAFHRYGRNTVLIPPIRLVGTRHIALGSGIYIGRNSWLQAISETGSASPLISVSDSCSFAGNITLSAVLEIYIEEKVLFARNVYISDHSHSFRDLDRAILDQGIDRIAPVRIGKGSWIGQNAVILPGVSIGRGSVVGANSVVSKDVPDFTIVAGAPAKVIRKISG